MPAGHRDDRQNRRRRRSVRRPKLTPPHITVTDTDAEEDWAEPGRQDLASDVQEVYQSRQPPIDELRDESWADEDADNEAEESSWRDSPPDRRDEADRRGRDEDDERGRGRREEDGRLREEEDHPRDALTEEEMLLQTATPYGARSNTPNEWGFGHSRAASRADSADEEIPEELEGRSRSRSRYKNVGPRVDSRRNSVTLSHSGSLQDLSQRQVHWRDNFAGTRHASLDLSPRPRSEPRSKPRNRSRSRSRSVSRLAMKKEDAGYETDYDQVSSRFAEAGEKRRARRILVYKNGDPWFQGWEMRFVPSRDNMDNLYKMISERFGRCLACCCCLLACCTNVACVCWVLSGNLIPRPTSGEGGGEMKVISRLLVISFKH